MTDTDGHGLPGPDSVSVSADRCSPHPRYDFIHQSLSLTVPVCCRVRLGSRSCFTRCYCSVVFAVLLVVVCFTRCYCSVIFAVSLVVVLCYCITMAVQWYVNRSLSLP